MCTQDLDVIWAAKSSCTKKRLTPYLMGALFERKIFLLLLGKVTSEPTLASKLSLYKCMLVILMNSVYLMTYYCDDMHIVGIECSVYMISDNLNNHLAKISSYSHPPYKSSPYSICTAFLLVVEWGALL